MKPSEYRKLCEKFYFAQLEIIMRAPDMRSGVTCYDCVRFFHYYQIDKSSKNEFGWSVILGVFVSFEKNVKSSHMR